MVVLTNCSQVQQSDSSVSSFREFTNPWQALDVAHAQLLRGTRQHEQRIEVIGPRVEERELHRSVHRELLPVLHALATKINFIVYEGIKGEKH